MSFKIHRFIAPKSLFLLAVALLFTPLASAAPAKTEKAEKTPNVVETAFGVAENPNPLSYVYATVTLTALGNPRDLPKVLIGRGAVRMEGDLLQGQLDLTFDDAAKAKVGKHQLLFNVSRGNRVGLQWLINDKPRNFAALKAFDAQTTPDSLTAKINWNGADWLLMATLETRKKELVKIPLPPAKLPIPDKSKEKKPLVIITKPMVIKPTKKAVGRNFIVTGRFLVTNSEDGVGGIWGSADDTVELTGGISINGQNALSLNNKSAGESQSFVSKELRFGLRYDDPNLHYCSVRGSIYDTDRASSSDGLWRANQAIDLMQIMQSNREFVIKGDRDSESGDLYIRVVDGGEIME